MSGNEVAGLQALAMAHGGSLTINPQTGLPEAGFLDKLLPAIIGAGAVYLSGGTITPMMAGLGIGGIETARTGDLGQGIMAGLGAYGGGSLGAGLTTTGAGAIPANVGEQVAPALTSGPSAVTAGMTPGSQAAMLDAQTAGMFEGASQGQMLAAQNAGMGAATQGEMLASQTAGMTPGYGEFLAGNKANLAMAASPAIMDAMQPDMRTPEDSDQMIRPYKYAYNQQTPQNMIGSKYTPGQDTSERMWFQPEYTALEPYKAAQGGLMAFAAGGMPVEQMSRANSVGQNTGYPMADVNKAAYATPWQTPVGQNVVQGAADTGVNPMTGEMNFAAGGISNLGSYSDGGRLLKGPGDGMSDSIPAKIGSKQPARLADGEFVVPADVVSHLGNGSTDAGAKQLYKMMDRIRAQRTGKKKQAPEVNPKKALPA
jgi:hypothetical protein